MPEIPSVFLNAISKGNCTLFLGAGVSKEASAPTADELSRKIAKELWDVDDWDLPLDRCMSIARAQNQLSTAQQIIIETVRKLTPSSSHRLLPSYPWRAIVTTNYDQLVEDVFRETRGSSLVSIVDAGGLANPNPWELPYLKIHGCASRPDLIVASGEDLYNIRRERQPLVSYVETLHCTGPVVYVGYSFRDVHIIDLIYDLNRRLGPLRQPILFVGAEGKSKKDALESAWFTHELKGNYLAVGFRKFMTQLALELKALSLASRLAEALAPCRVETFVSNAKADVDLREQDGFVECWLTYSIATADGFAGANLVPARRSADLSSYSRMVFQINVPDEERRVQAIEALNMREDESKMHFNVISLDGVSGAGWHEIRCELSSYKNLSRKSVNRLSLADNGSRVTLNKTYRVGLRGFRLER